jgi:hypothetical protein
MAAGQNLFMQIKATELNRSCPVTFSVNEKFVCNGQSDKIEFVFLKLVEYTQTFLSLCRTKKIAFPSHAKLN